MNRNLPNDSASLLAQQSVLDVASAGWLVRRQQGFDGAEEAAFQQWLSADAAHRSAYDELAAAWQHLDALPASAIDSLRPAPAAPEKSRSGWLHTLCQPPRLAAAALLCLALVGWQAWQRQPVYSASFASARGQQLTVSLPDGSSLQLDTATRAEVTLYRQRREVRLPEGQALFTVAPDKARPFTVLAGPLAVTVVGTRFAVRHTHSGLDDGGTSVHVEQGRVRVAGMGSTLELTAGQFVRSDGAGTLSPLTSATADNALLWREGRVQFNNTPLRQALAEFERYGPTQLRLANPALGDLRLYGSFSLNALASFRRALPQVLPVRLHEEGGVTVISAAP